MNLQEINEQVQSLIVPAKQGDANSINRLWELVRPFMEGRAHRYLVKFYRDTEDLPGVCYLAFEESLRRYDTSRNFTFISFCVFMVKYHMISYLRKRVEVERHEVPFSAMMSNQLSLEDGDYDEEERLIHQSLGVSLYRFEDELLLRTTVRSRIDGAHLNPTCMKVVEMLLCGHTPHDIQCRLGLSRSTYYHIIQRLRKALEGLEEYV